MKISVNIFKQENEFIANCPELDINCYGDNRNEALKRIQSVIHFYIDSARELGFDVENLHEILVDGDIKKPSVNISNPNHTDLVN